MLVGAFGLSLKVELMTRDTNDLLKVKNRISFFFFVLKEHITNWEFHKL